MGALVAQVFPIAWYCVLLANSKQGFLLEVSCIIYGITEDGIRKLELWSVQCVWIRAQRGVERTESHLEGNPKRVIRALAICVWRANRKHILTNKQEREQAGKQINKQAIKQANKQTNTQTQKRTQTNKHTKI